MDLPPGIALIFHSCGLPRDRRTDERTAADVRRHRGYLGVSHGKTVPERRQATPIPHLPDNARCVINRSENRIEMRVEKAARNSVFRALSA